MYSWIVECVIDGFCWFIISERKQRPCLQVLAIPEEAWYGDLCSRMTNQYDACVVVRDRSDHISSRSKISYVCMHFHVAWYLFFFSVTATRNWNETSLLCFIGLSVSVFVMSFSSKIQQVVITGGSSSCGFLCDDVLLFPNALFSVVLCVTDANSCWC